MQAETALAEQAFAPSGFWADLNEKNQRMLSAEGLANFKRTVAQNYFNWLIQDDSHPYFQHVKKSGPAPLLTAISTLREMDGLMLTTNDEPLTLSKRERDAYRRYVCHVWAIMRKHDKRGLRRQVTEPAVGNPFPIKFGRRILSQDLATSIVECNLIADLRCGVPNPRIAELGAGYGRLAYVYAKTQPGTYYVFDIHPALDVAQWYATQTLGADKVFTYRQFDDVTNVLYDIASSKVAFFTPEQLKNFPPKYFDTVLSISTLPEMRPDQVQMYLREFQRLAHGHIFLKQWKNWTNPIDGTAVTPSDYKFDAPFQLTLNREDPIIPDFVNMIWRSMAA